jgi:hypothetical protein
MTRFEVQSSKFEVQGPGEERRENEGVDVCVFT